MGLALEADIVVGRVASGVSVNLVLTTELAGGYSHRGAGPAS